MKKTNNFISIVALGNFNPAILTPSFLNEKCEFKSSSKPKGQINPVATLVEYDDISFLIDMERFQIKEKNIPDFNETAIIKLMNKYLEVLTYTPVYLMGVNFNIKLENNPETAINNLNSREMLLEVLETKTILYKPTIQYSKEITTNISWEFKKIENEKKSSITVNLGNNIFNVNYNVEIEKINVNKDNKYFFSNNFGTINKEFLHFIENIF